MSKIAELAAAIERGRSKLVANLVQEALDGAYTVRIRAEF